MSVYLLSNGTHGSADDKVKELTKERDEWRKKFKDQERALMCELRDPNGTIWEHAKSLQDQVDRAVKMLMKDKPHMSEDFVRGMFRGKNK